MVAQIVRLIDVQLYMGQECLNVYDYLDADGVADPAVLAADWRTDVLPLVAHCQVSAVTHVNLSTQVIYPAVGLRSDHPIAPPVAGGDAETTILAAFVAYSVKYSLSDQVVITAAPGRRISRGGKRFVGVGEAHLGTDGQPNAGTITDFAAATAEIMDPGTDPWQLVVTHQPYTKGTPEQVVARYALVTGISAPSVSSQNTRKVLRGRTY